MLKKWDSILSRVIGSFAGVFTGYSIYKYFHYKKYPGLYEIQSAPWYIGIQINGLFTAIIILTALILKLLIKRKLKNI